MAPPDPFDAAFLRRLEYLRVVARHLAVGERAVRREPGAAAGRAPGPRGGPGLEFAEYRPYSPGDDYRHVDWAALARLDRLVLRLCRQEEDRLVDFLLDVSASMAGGRPSGRPPPFDHARRLVAALATVGLAGLDRVRLFAVADGVRGHLDVGRSRAGLLAVLEWLRGLRAEGPTDLAAGVRAYLSHVARRGTAVVVSDLMDPAGWQEPLARLQAHGQEVWCLLVTDRRGLLPEADGEWVLADAETGERLAVCLGPEVRRRLRATAERFGAEVRAWCLGRGIGYAEAPVEVPADALVLDVLRREGLVV